MSPANDVAGPYAPRQRELGQQLADILERIMAADLAVILAEYDRASQPRICRRRVRLRLVRSRPVLDGPAAAFPDAAFRIEHAIGRDDR